jgi:hypothetical protein
VEKMFIQQSPSTRMLSFEITSNPQWLTGGKKTEDDKITLVRSGLAVTCNFILQDDNGTYDLKGVFTWVGSNLDIEPITRVWMDIDGTLDKFGKDGLLKSRIYELDA